MDWIIQHILGAGKAIADLARRVADGFATLWNTLVTAFARWAMYFGLLVSRTIDLGAAVNDLLWQMVYTFIWVVEVKLPGLATTLGNDIRKWALAQINAAVALAGRLVNAARAYALSLVDTAKAFLLNLIGTVRADLNRAITLLNTVAHLVLSLLTSPVALADWIAGAIVSAVLRYARARADTLARMVLANAIRWTGLIAVIIEGVIADIL